MKKLLYVMGLGLLLAPAAAFAAPTGWLPPADCHIPPDHAVYSADGSVVTGCITEAAWSDAAARQAANNDQAKLSAFIFPAGSSKVGSNGVSYTCPWWFFSFSCVLPDVAR